MYLSSQIEYSFIRIMQVYIKLKKNSFKIYTSFYMII